MPEEGSSEGQETFRTSEAALTATGFNSTLSPWKVDGTPPTIVQFSGAVEGTGVAKMTLTATSPVRERSELAPTSTMTDAKFYYDKDYWIGFAIRIEKWETPPSWAMLFQTHAVPRDWADTCNGEKVIASRNPVSITMSSSGALSVNAITTPNLNTHTGGAGATTVQRDSSPAATLRWYRYVIHLRPSDTSNGLLQVWRDGVLLYERAGANVDQKDSCGGLTQRYVYPKLGIYRSYDNTGTQSILYDDVKIYTGSVSEQAGYDTVKPNGTPPKP